MLTLVGATMAALMWLLAAVLGADGLSVVDMLMLLAFTVTLPWTVLGFWNAVIGLVILRACRDPLRVVAPLAGLDERRRRTRARTAIVVPVYNEDPELVERHLCATVEDLARDGGLDGFEVFLLSDTNDEAIIPDEEAAVATLRSNKCFGHCFHYRRRLDNVGYKTGNLWSFIDVHGGRFDYMLVLDADSLMTGAAIRRLVRVMDANPRLGILQTLITGLPTRSGFTRLFQFGMRHAMRSYTTGSAWWQGAAGPYWGHNALIRMAAFRAHCRIETLPGRPPWGGLVLSHDLVEAVMMQRAGYDVRVLPDEFGSHELNPPCLPEFARRSLRWCQGNLQYVGLLRRETWHVMGRVQLALAVLMYLSGPAWLLFMALGFVQGALGVDSGAIASNPWGAAPSWLGACLLAIMLLMIFAPKIAGILDALWDPERRRSYGGGAALVGAGLVELVYGMILAPIMALSEAFFIGRLLTGRGLAWTAQRRGDGGVAIAEAVRRFWPQTVAGAVVLAAFGWLAPGLLVWIVPVVVGPLLVIPFAWLSARPALGRALARSRFAAIPEEIEPSTTVAAAVPWLARTARLAPAPAMAPDDGDLMLPAPTPAGGSD